MCDRHDSMNYIVQEYNSENHKSLLEDKELEDDVVSKNDMLMTSIHLSALLVDITNQSV